MLSPRGPRDELVVQGRAITVARTVRKAGRDVVCRETIGGDACGNPNVPLDRTAGRPFLQPRENKRDVLLKLDAAPRRCVAYGLGTAVRAAATDTDSAAETRVLPNRQRSAHEAMESRSSPR